jgi:hypothetical protein
MVMEVTMSLARRVRRPIAVVRRCWLAGALLAATPALGAAQQPATGCADQSGFDALDFWVGDWDVYIGDQQVGTDRVEKILAGCAVAEHWTSATGGLGQSLFYYQPVTGEWRQVWVTTGATQLGGVKEKRLTERLADGSVRFVGEIPVEGGGSYLDRTTLTPLDGGRVRQLIEISTDDGRTWQSTFDAVYR